MAMISSAKKTGKNNNTIEREKKNNTINYGNFPGLFRSILKTTRHVPLPSSSRTQNTHTNLRS